MPGVRRLPSGKLQGWYRDAAGRRRYYTCEDLKATKAQVRAIVARLEDEHHQVRLGYRPARTSADRHRTRPFGELAEEFLAWGAAQGGVGGLPWAPRHLRQRRVMLDWWRQRLGLETIADLDDILPRAEAAVRDLLAAHRGATVAAYTTSLHALCRWAQMRGYLRSDPLHGIVPADTRPQRQRRALTPDEVARLLAAASPPRSLVYQAALTSGLRANELRSLTEADLDTDRGGLVLRAEWTKNRQPGFQPLPAALVAQLAASRTGDAKAPLLAVHHHPYLPLDADLAAAGIPKWTPAGVVDFHSLRVTYVTWLVELSAANVREVQALARHATPALTMGTYAKVRDTGLRAAVERIGAVFARSCAPGVHGAERPSDGSAASDCAASDNAGR